MSSLPIANAEKAGLVSALAPTIDNLSSARTAQSTTTFQLVTSPSRASVCFTPSVQWDW